MQFSAPFARIRVAFIARNFADKQMIDRPSV